MTAQDAVVVESTGGASTRSRQALVVALVVAALALAIDQGSKVLAAAQLTQGERIPLVGDLFGLSLVYNPGAAFSLGSGSTWIFTLVGLLAAIAVVVFAVRLRGARWGAALGLVLGGAVGNLVDRLLNPPSFGQGQVTDFLAYGDLFVGNVADVFVVAGVGLLCLILLPPGPDRASNDARFEDAA